MHRGVEWMAGGNYNLIAVNVLVAYKRGRERIEGESVALCSPSFLCRQGDGATLDRKFVRDGVPQENGRLFGEVVLITENAE